MARPVRDTIKIQIALTPSVIEELDKECEMFGISRSAYISQIIMQKGIELESRKLLKSMTAEQLQIAVHEQLREKK